MVFLAWCGIAYITWCVVGFTVAGLRDRYALYSRFEKVLVAGLIPLVGLFYVVATGWRWFFWRPIE